jgi:hypothetical protein
METERGLEIPKTIKTAVSCLWASVALGFVTALVKLASVKTAEPAVSTNFVLLFIFGFIAFLILKISAGKNWARIVFLILFLIGSVTSLPGMLYQFLHLPVIGLSSLAQVGLQGYGLYILFRSSGNNWFRPAVTASPLV